MRRFKLGIQTSFAAVFVLGLSAVAANAGVYTVEYWNYNGGSTFGPLTQAAETNTIIASPADAVFTFTGDINWFVPGPQGGSNLAGPFVTFSGGVISGYTSPSTNIATQTDFENTNLSSVGDSTTSFFRIIGSGIFNSGSILHDDGASLYLDGSSTAIVSQPVETSAELGTFVLPGPLTSHSFVLDYVEGNGSPSQLLFTTAVPEASTWAMMILGFLGIGFLGYRKTAKSSGPTFRMA